MTFQYGLHKRILMVRVIALVLALSLVASACDNSTPSAMPTDTVAPAKVSTGTPGQPDTISTEDTLEPVSITPRLDIPAATPEQVSPTEGSGQVAAMPVVPNIDATMKARLREVLLKGSSLGNRANVFAKIGDSITESGSFLQSLACKDETLGSYTGLAGVLDYFRAGKLPPGYASSWCGESDSFSRASVSAVSGWIAGQALQPLDNLPTECAPPHNTALDCELRLLKPGIALIMYGTNDLQAYNDLAVYGRDLREIVRRTLDTGVIPVLSTIPPRLDQPELGARVEPHNRVVLQVAAEQGIPVWNYWLALQEPTMLNQGVDEDGIHPNVYKCPPCDASNFTAEGLRYGYNMRNLTALQVLDKLKRVVIEDGEPDSGS